MTANHCRPLTNQRKDRFMADANRTVFIYDLTDPRTGHVRYVGKSLHPSARLATHIREARGCSVVHCKRWIAGLLAIGVRPALGIIETIDDGTANEAERYWIGCFRSTGADLTNKTPGGDGQAPGYKPTAETIAKQRAASLGKRATADARANIRAAFNRPEVRQRRSEITAARMADPQQRAIAQRGRTGIPMSESAKQKIAASWTPERKATHAAEKAALPFNDRWRAQLAAALKARWDKRRALVGSTEPCSAKE